jgi:hypothetical protein
VEGPRGSVLRAGKQSVLKLEQAGGVCLVYGGTPAVGSEKGAMGGCPMMKTPFFLTGRCPEADK